MNHVTSLRELVPLLESIRLLSLGAKNLVYSFEKGIWEYLLTWQGLESSIGARFALGWAWCYGKAGYLWRLIDSCFTDIMLELGFPSFFWKSFLSLTRRKSMTWIIAVCYVNTFAQKLGDQNHLWVWWFSLLSFPRQTLHGSGKAAVKYIRRTWIVTDGNTEPQGKLLRNFSWEQVSSHRKFPVSSNFSSNTVKRESLSHIIFFSYQFSRENFPKIL